MMIPIFIQFKLIISSIIAGFITGILYDVYRIIRGMESPNKIITFIEDTLFWTLTSIIVFVFLLYTDYVYMGIYIYVYLILGIYLYIKFISKFFLKIFRKILSGLGRGIRILTNNLIYPFQIAKSFLSCSKKNKKTKRK